MMFEHRKIQKLDDYFTDLNARREQGVYFYRINGYNDAIKQFIQNYYEAARLSGVVIEGKIPNPDEKNLSYYAEIMGMDFQMSVGFIGASLQKWLPRLNDYQRKTVATSIYDTLDAMRREGKNDNMLKNAYIKFMCWMYYKFERILSRLGQDKIPKILYEGDISNYELKLITILSGAGCDVLLLQYHGDCSYLKLDPESKLSCSSGDGKEDKNRAAVWYKTPGFKLYECLDHRKRASGYHGRHSHQRTGFPFLLQLLLQDQRC